MYPGITIMQLKLLYPGKEKTVSSLLQTLQNQGRIEVRNAHLFLKSSQADTDNHLTKSIWVLLDFISNVEYHSASDFPIKIMFFSDKKEYEIIYVEHGKEVLINRIMQQNKSPDIPHRIVVVEDADQISALSFPGISAFCTVSDDGRTNYYVKRTEADNWTSK